MIDKDSKYEILEKLDALRVSVDSVLGEFRVFDTMPYCMIGGCEGLSNDCHLHCPNSLIHIAKIIAVNAIDTKLKSLLDTETYVELRRRLGYGLGNRIDVGNYYAHQFSETDEDVIIDGNFNEYEIYDIYNPHNSLICKAYCMSAFHQSMGDGESKYTRNYGVFKRISNLKKLFVNKSK